MVYKVITYFQQGLTTIQPPFLPKIERLESITWKHICSDESSLPCVVKFVALV